MLMLNVEKYPEAMKGLIGQVTNVSPATGKRQRKASSTSTHDLIVRYQTNQITLRLQESDLYLVAFTNANRTYCFKDHVVSGATPLPYGSSYTAKDGLAILAEETAPVATATRDLVSISEAIRDLAAYNGDRAHAHALKPSLGAMAYLVSESMRFKNIYQWMCRVTREGQSFTFAQFADWVKNWSRICTSDGGLPGVVTHADLATWY
jgi:hypothetical protein